MRQGAVGDQFAILAGVPQVSGGAEGADLALPNLDRLWRQQVGAHRLPWLRLPGHRGGQQAVVVRHGDDLIVAAGGQRPVARDSSFPLATWCWGSRRRNPAASSAAMASHKAVVFRNARISRCQMSTGSGGKTLPVAVSSPYQPARWRMRSWRQSARTR
jgi:hypothetical protein